MSSSSLQVYLFACFVFFVHCSLKLNVTQSDESWVLGLKLCCFPANEQRCQIVAKVLSDTGINSVDRLIKAPPMKNWVNVEVLISSERTALEELVRLLRIRRARNEYA